MPCLFIAPGFGWGLFFCFNFASLCRSNNAEIGHILPNRKNKKPRISLAPLDFGLLPWYFQFMELTRLELHNNDAILRF